MNIRDPLHGYISLTEEEEELIDTPQLQRLRRIRQLGLSYLVYPGATHTRFQHSLGVMHLAGKFADSLELDDEKKREVRTAALLHDSGHGPFSHASEFVAERHGLGHEEISCRVAEELSERYSADASRVKKMIKGKLEIGQIVAGDIDADRIDYLMRDAHTSGLQHGQIESDTIIRLAEINSRRIVFDFKAVQALESLFTARFHMIKSLYNHHASQIAEKMLERALESYLQQGNKLEEMMSMDDYTAHTALLNSEGASRILYRRIKDRELYKRSLVVDEEKAGREALRNLESELEESEMEREIAETAGINPRKVIVNKPRTPEMKDIGVKVKKSNEVKDFSEVSPIPKALNEAAWRNVYLNVYSPESEKERVSEAAEKVLEEKI